MKGNTTTTPSSVMDTFDVVIRTQKEFDALVESPTWLDATSVCFVGNGGTLKFAKTEIGLKVPQTVKQIQGMNNAIIEITEFVIDHFTNKAALWYAIRPTTNDYSIRDLTVNCTGDRGWAFISCTQLTNCTGTGTGTSGDGFGFSSCTQLTNCTGTGNGLDPGYGFTECTQLTNCTGTGTSTAYGGYSFYYCSQLTNCTGTGFYRCTQLTNCTGIASDSDNGGYGFFVCTQLTNCTGTGTGDGNGCGFYDCTQLTNCTGTSTGIGGGSSAHGFYNCIELTNCTGTGTGDYEGFGFRGCTQLTNCTGTGRSTGTGTSNRGYGFYDCKWINGCKQGTTASTTSFLGGTNAKVDTLTVIAV